MRSLVPDDRYFRFLDNLRDAGGASVVFATGALVNEFPNLRQEEARAVFADWRATYLQRHPIPEALIGCGAFHLPEERANC